MKVFKRLCAGLIAGMLMISSVAAADVIDNTHYAADGETGKYTVTVTDEAIKDGNQYVLLIAKGVVDGGVIPEINTDTLTYINQTVADDNTVTFKDFIPKSVPNSVVLLGGEFNGKTSPVIIGYIDAAGVLVTGSVAFQTSNVGATIKIYDALGNEVVSGETTTEGAFSIEGVPTGEEFSLVVSKPGYCTYTLSNMTIEDAMELSEISIVNLAGDLDGDGYVNGYDLTNLLSDFNKGGSDIGMETADLDGDGYVNGYDLTYMLSSFNNGNVVVDYSK